jgi:hypothetical protein
MVFFFFNLLLKVLFQEKKSLLVLHFYTSVFPILKEYVLMFQTKQPMVHRLFDKQLELFKVFLAYFLRPEVFTRRSGKQMKTVEIEEKNFLTKDDMFLGGKTRKLISSMPKKDCITESFLQNVVSGYKLCGIYLQNKLPLDNKVLRSLSAIDPEARQHCAFLKALKKLGDIIPAGLTEEEEDNLEAEIHRYLT